MSKNNTDRLFEELLKEGASLAAEEMGEKAQEAKEDFSEAHKVKMEKLFARERRKLRIKRVLTYTARIAAIFVIVATVSGLAIFRVDALRVRFLNIFSNTNPTNTDVVFREGEAYTVGNISLEYIPDGFELEKEKVVDEMSLLKFRNRDEFFEILIRNSNCHLSIDTENADVEMVNLNGHEAFYTKKDDTNILAGYIGDNTISLIGNIDKNTLCKIYQKIKFN